MSTIESIDVQLENRKLSAMDLDDRIRWAVEVFGAKAVLLSSMQKTASVLMHSFYRLGITNEILFVDTGFHFNETLKVRDAYMRDYKLNLVTLYPEETTLQQEERYGKKLHLFRDGQPECCRLRKEEPFLHYVIQNEIKLVMIGSRQSDGGSRTGLQTISKDPRIKGYSMQPLFDWSSEQVASYLERHKLLIHPLHFKCFPSIGCACCTTAVAPGEHPRAGRWRHLRTPEEEGQMFCGINFTDGGGI